MNHSAKKLAGNIKRMRAQKNMTQGDLCRATGLDRAYVSNVEAGNKNPTLATIEKIAEAFSISIDELLK